nr:LysR family transcriptional regulator [Gammaproteobacteria bacterium]
YPDVSVDLVAADEIVDLVETGIDVAIRIGVLQNSSLVARKLGANQYVIAASPGYFERHAIPQKPSDLADHNCLIHKRSASPAAVWTFRRAQDSERIEVSGNLRADSFGIVKSAACLGQGIALLPAWSAMPCVEAGELQLLLPEFEAHPGESESDGGIYVVYPHRKLVSPKVRAFVDFMVEYVGSTSCWSPHKALPAAH